MLKMEDTLYKLDINFLFHLIVSPYGRLFNEQALFIDLQNIFTAFAVGLSGQKLNSEYYARKFFIIAVVFWVLVLGKDTKNMAEHVIMKKILMQCMQGLGLGLVLGVLGSEDQNIISCSLQWNIHF